MVLKPFIILLIFLSSVAFSAILFLGIYVLRTNPRASVNRLYFIFTILILSWCLGEIFIYSASDKESAYFWFRVSSFGWGFVDLILLHIIMLLTGINIFRKRWWLQIPYYLTGSFAFYGSVIVPETITDFKLTSYGWSYLSNPPVWWVIANDGKMMVIISLIIILLAIWYHKSSHPLRRIQAKIILGTILLSLIFYIAVLYILPSFKAFQLPNIQHLVLAFWSAGMGYAIIKYKLMILTPESIAPQVLKTMADSLIVVDTSSRITLVNDSAVILLESSKNYLIGLKITEVFPEEQFFQGDLLNKIRLRGAVENVEVLYRKKSGSVIPLLLSASVVYDRFKTPAGVVLVLRDISERKKAEVNLRFMATHDLLTGLPNRTVLNDRLRQAIARAKRYKHFVGVMVIDLDKFKEVNDTLGHSAGDALLKSVSLRLKTSIRESDTVVRLGGDEFVIVLTDLSGVDSLKTVADRIMDSFNKPFIIYGRKLFITPSIGISIYPNDGDNIDELLRKADMSLYKVKESGRNNYQFYSSETESEKQKILQLEKDLQTAFEKNEIEISYLPIFELEGSKVFAVEAIFTWNHSERGKITPETFISIAERSELINKLSEWMIRAVCNDLKRWKNLGHTVPVVMNISLKYLTKNESVEMIENILRENGLSPSFLKLEIKDDSLTAGIDKYFENINLLHNIGVSFILNQSGSVFPSQLWLKIVPAQAIKISSSLIRNVNSDPYDEALVRSIVLIANSFNIKVIIEGVEKKEQLDFIKALATEKPLYAKCNAVQGSLFCEPMDAESLSQFISRTLI